MIVNRSLSTPFVPWKPLLDYICTVNAHKTVELYLTRECDRVDCIEHWLIASLLYDSILRQLKAPQTDQFPSKCTHMDHIQHSNSIQHIAHSPMVLPYIFQRQPLNTNEQKRKKITTRPDARSKRSRISRPVAAQHQANTTYRTQHNTHTILYYILPQPVAEVLIQPYIFNLA